MGDFTDLLGSNPEAEPDPLTTPATQPQQRKSQFQTLIDGPSPQDAALGSNLLGAASTTPDAHAKAMDIGGAIGAPADAVAANLKETERQAKLQRYRDALNDAPKLQKLLAEDPDLAKISADDLKVLGDTESTLGKILSAFYGGSPEAGDRLADIGRALPAGGLEGTGIAMEGVAALNDVIGRTAARGYRAVGLDTLGDLADPATRPWWLNPSAIFGAGGTELRDVGKAVGPDEDRQNLATDIAGGVGQVAAQIATVLLTGGAASTASMFAQGAGILAERVEEQGKTGTTEGDAAIVMGASVTALTEKMGLDALLHRVPPAIRNGILRTLVDIGIGGGIEAVQEVSEGILHNLIAMVTIDPNAKLLEGVEQDAKAAGGTGVVIRALVNAATKGRQISSNVQKQQRAAHDAATVDALVKGTADSKLRERNPDAFSAVMAAQTQGTPVETFYVPATAIAELYQSGAGTFDDDPLNQIEGLREQYQEALAVGGDVEISAADYLTHIAPTDLHGRLKNDIRASRDGWSVNDAKEYAEDPAREADLSALVERLALQGEGAAVGQATFDDVYKQLMDTGRYESHQAAASATLIRERYIARAALGTGQDPDALYLRDQVQVSGPGALARVRRGDLDVVIARLKSGETSDRAKPGRLQAAKTPVLDIVRKAGGVKLGSQLDSELRAMGVNPKTHPGLFKKTGGIGDVDNFVLSEHDVLRDNGIPDSGNGYADRDAVLEALRREAGGRGAALLTQDEREQRARLDEPVSVLAEQLEAAGLDPKTMTADEIKAWATGQQTAAPADAQGALFQGPVATLTGEEIIAADASVEEIRDAARAWYRANLAGTKATRADLGEIVFVAEGLKKAVSASADPLKLRLFPALRAIIEQGRVGDPVPNTNPKKRNVLRYHFIEAAVTVGSETVRVVVNVEERTDGKIYYNHTMPERMGRELYQSGAQVQDPSIPEGPSSGERRGTDGAVLPEVIGPGPSEESVTNAGDDVNLTVVGRQPTELFQSVYHGSPHIFDRFSTAAIGSGEGAQAYGFGLYFAGKKEIAQYYRETLAGPQMTWDGEPVTARNIDAVEADVTKALGEEGLRLTMYLWGAGSVAELRRKFPELEISAKAETYLNKHLKSSPGGRLYTVEIPDDGEYLLHDKPLSEQPQAVRKAVEQVLDDYDIPGIADDYTGQDVYRAMENWAAATTAEGIRHNPSQTVSELLLAAGVRGIKYLDASARDSSGDSFNYVVFADADVVIQSYEQAAAGGPRGSYQRVRDPYGNLSNVIRLTEGANLSTALHEFGHFFLFQLIDDATLPGATAEARVKLQADLQTALDHLGIKVDVATSTADQIHAAMTREAHELWARSFEVYAREGKAPSAALRDAFASFASWLVRIYRTLKAIPDYRKKLTPEVRGVMDRLLATEDAIKDAQSASSFRVPSALRSVMTAAEQKSLERLTAQANMEAREELTRRVMKEMERERLEWWREERAKVRERVEADVRSRPVYRAYNLIRTGQTADGGQLVDENGNPRAMKLDRKTLERDYGKDIVKLLPKGLTAKDGASHHVVASWTGFGSADELRDALLNIQPMKEVIEAETDAAMKQRHGDMLSDGRIAEDASEVVLNEKQLDLAALQAKALRRLAASVMEKAAARTVAETGAKSAATDRAAVLEAQADEQAVATMGVPAAGVAGVSAEAQMAAATAAASVTQRTAQRAALRQTRGITSGLDVKAITAAAKKAIGAKRIEDAVPGRYRAQADRLGRQIEQAIAKRDYQKAATLKEQQLINLALAREAQEVQASVGKAVKRFSRLRKPDSKLAGATDIEFVGAARAILARFGLSTPAGGFDQQVWFQRLAEDDPAGAVDMQQMIEAATAGAGTVAARGRTRTRAKPGGAPTAMGDVWRQMTVDEFRSLTDTVDALLHMGRDARSVQIEGERVAIKAAVGEMLAQASGRDSGKRIGQTEAVTPWEKKARSFWATAAFLERVESWARRMDNGKVGPFTKYLLRPVLAAVYEYRAEKTRRIKQLVDILEPRKAELLGKPIHSDELNYTFQNKGALLHALLHSGNDSNFRKLLLGGRGKGFAWGEIDKKTGALDTSKWDRMINRMVRDGTLTKADYDTAQAIWDLLEELKGPAQIAHRKMKGFYFQEVETPGIQTPFGKYRGGYVPAVTDRTLNPEAGARVDANAMGEMANAGILPSVARGFTKSRVEYNQPLELNVSKLTGHMDTVLKFTHLGPVIRDVTRLAINREFRQEMFGIDPHAIDEVLVPWLQRVARQTVEIPPTSEGGRTAATFFKGLQKRTGIQAMAGNLLNAAQQITGISVAMVRVKPHRVLRGLVSSTFAPRHSSQMIMQKSAFMKDRMDSTSMELMTTINDLLEQKSALRKVRDKTDKHGYFAQIYAQNLVDRAVWLGAYEQGIAAGKTEDEAVLEADSVVRTTQGSFAPEDVSRVEVQNAFIRPFLQFYSYFNAQYNLLRTEFDATVTELGWVGGSPRLFYIYLVGAMIPAVLAEAMTQAARGELGDDDDDGLIDDIGELFLLSQLRYFAAMVPGVGPLVNLGIHLGNDKPYDDRLSTAPVFGQAERIVTSGFKLATGSESTAGRAVADALMILGMLTGLPLGQAGKPAGYVADVLTGEQQGETVGDWIRGTLSGREAPKQ